MSSSAAYDLLPADIAATIPALYDVEKQPDPIVHPKWFTPDSSWTWYVLETDGDTCFGLIVGHERELGYFSLEEIKSVRGPLGLRVERDLYLDTLRPLEGTVTRPSSPPRYPAPVPGHRSRRLNWATSCGFASLPAPPHVWPAGASWPVHDGHRCRDSQPPAGRTNAKCQPLPLLSHPTRD